jgi:hypothetical protein
MNITKLLQMVFVVTLNIWGFHASAQAVVNTDNLAVYKFQETKPVTIDTTKSYIKKFLPSETYDNLKISDSNIVYYVSDKDANTTFEHNQKTNDISFQRNFSRYLGAFVPNLPKTDAALKYANAFLEKNNLMPANPKELKVAHVGGLRTTSVLKTGKPGPVIDKLTTITFSRELNGIPVIGAGSKMIVNIGDNGEIVGVTKRWRELDKPTRLDASQIISQDEALKLASRQILSEFGQGSRFKILQTQLAYFDNNGTAIQPVFAFQTKIQLEDQALPPLEYVSVIPAMRKPVEELNLTKTDELALKYIQKDTSLVPSESWKDPD